MIKLSHFMLLFCFLNGISTQSLTFSKTKQRSTNTKWVESYFLNVFDNKTLEIQISAKFLIIYYEKELIQRSTHNQEVIRTLSFEGHQVDERCYPLKSSVTMELNENYLIFNNSENGIVKKSFFVEYGNKLKVALFHRTHECTKCEPDILNLAIDSLVNIIICLFYCYSITFFQQKYHFFWSFSSLLLCSGYGVTLLWVGALHLFVNEYAASILLLLTAVLYIAVLIYLLRIYFVSNDDNITLHQKVKCLGLPQLTCCLFVAALMTMVQYMRRDIFYLSFKMSTILIILFVCQIIPALYFHNSCNIRKESVIVCITGKEGVGKTEIARRLSRVGFILQLLEYISGRFPQFDILNQILLNISPHFHLTGISNQTINFESTSKAFTLLDVKSDIPNFSNNFNVTNLCDYGIIVVEASDNNYENQVRQQIKIFESKKVKGLGVIINYFNTVNPTEETYNNIKRGIQSILDYSSLNHLQVPYIPTVAPQGLFLHKKSCNHYFVWYNGPTVFDYIESLTPIYRNRDEHVRMTIYRKDSKRNLLHGKLQTGKIAVGRKLFLMPHNINVIVEQCFENGEEVMTAKCGSFVTIRVINTDRNDLKYVQICCSDNGRGTTANRFNARVRIFERINPIQNEFEFMLHIHSKIFSARITQIISQINKYTGAVSNTTSLTSDNQYDYIVTIETAAQVCIYPYSDFPELSRIMLAKNDRVFGMGNITG